MTRVIIHAGMHKTATTAFQFLSNRFSEELRSQQIFYPLIKEMGPSHNQLAFDIYKDDYSLFEKIIENGRKVAGKNGSIILSSENLQSTLARPHYAKLIERKIFELGDFSIEWIFVVRDPFQYFESLYAEMSKWGLQLELASMGETLLTHGYISLLNPQYAWDFIFDYRSFFEAFRKQIVGSLNVIPFETMLDRFPGCALFETAGADKATLRSIEKFYSSSESPGVVNERPSNLQVEINYAVSFLGLDNNDLQNEAIEKLVMIVAKQRLRKREIITEILRNKFKKRFKSHDLFAQV